ncbi:BsuPI-related putative proteinase inhibitor [Aquibacillus sp. 3ASR75-11]|uniref:Intracellular proteinase inhibitor BsuPI domain-containing protein n=1 Tax=Terrihalobacillus insolitus TaxID=2950438 RepID=A0A9X3WT58_9BACI|nr:BsuPI-related putative proteinase inhibitor [Terrihalobacillus insolitus]MDC3414477.1 BsuPI-related putative proteinase inhibitor [Terrihalobacillus insolitus]MDC3425357.1 BsuPI-related putative proteinase inhibitor [Terrihalobacillus insolitus]
MKKVLLFVLLGLLITGCGTGNADASQEKGEGKNGGESGIVAGEMVASLDKKSALVYSYQVKNQTEKVVTLEFTSSQRIDYSVETKDGEQVFLYSSVSSFLAVLGEEKVKQGEALEYTVDLNDLNLPAGEYILTVWMTPKDGKKFTVKKEFTIE